VLAAVVTAGLVLAGGLLPVRRREQRHQERQRLDGRRDIRTVHERAAIEQVYAADMDYAKRSIGKLQSGVPGARVVELAGENHYVFLSNEQDVLREIRQFLAGLH